MLYLLVCLCGSFAAAARTFPGKGVPPLRNFTPAEYQNSGKIWAVRSAPNGMIYMAADRGLLEYDGITWTRFAGSNGITRSLYVASDSLIYTGSDLDFGVWRKNKYQGFDYTSLYPFQEDLQDVNEEFWQIHPWQQGMLFVSAQSMYILRNEQLVKISAPSAFTGSFRVDESIYFSDREHGIFVFEELSLRKIFEFPDGMNPDLSGIARVDEGLLLITRDDGLYLYAGEALRRINPELSKILIHAKVFSFEVLEDGHLAFGTVLHGLFITDSNGKVIHHINRQKGLPGNTILSMHFSPARKLWMGMDYGASSLDLTSPVTTVYDFRGDFGTGYTAALKDETFYLGTNQGLYTSNWDDLDNDMPYYALQLIPGSEGQVWALEHMHDKLFMGHDRGLFMVEGKALRQISEESGVWTIIPYKDFILTGNYNGIHVFQASGDTWVFEKKMELIYGSCNQLILEHDHILWVNIPNFGLIRAELDEALHPVERRIFPSEGFGGTDLYILSDELGIKVITDQYRYVYDESQAQFIRTSESLPLPGLENQLAGHYLPVRLHPDYAFIPVYNGFALKYLQSNNATTQQNHRLTLRKMEGFNNHEHILLYPGARVSGQVNNFRIEMLIPNNHDALYQYRIGNAGTWSAWKPDHTVELLGLKHGAYRVHLRAMVGHDMVDEQVISFRIAPPWYLTWYAFATYFLLLVLLGYVIYSWQRLSLRKQKKRMLLREQHALRQQTEKHKRQIMMLEQKRLQEEYDQLKQQLKSKTIELAKKARDNEEKNRLLMALKEKCEKARQHPPLFDMKWQEMQRLLDSYMNIEDRAFDIQMDELHQEFFRTLKERFPDLSNNDLRLCAYLKIGLNSKEIAELLNIQPSSLYISRSRLRKKLNLQEDENLYSFLNAV